MKKKKKKIISPKRKRKAEKKKVISLISKAAEEKKEIVLPVDEPKEEKKKSIFAKRAQQIMKYLLLLVPIKKIPDFLGITEDTVRTHIKIMHLKTDCHSLLEQTVWALSHGYTVNQKEQKVWLDGVEII